MRIATAPADLRIPVPRPLILVPTMGALHDGHVSLIRIARKAAGAKSTVAVSIFVNPIQFDRASDLESYPQPLARDLEICRQEGVDLAFTPPPGSMYFPDRSVTVSESALSSTLCGAARPGHFDGVCTVVLKLFHLFQPDAAVFGEKDYQQLAVIRRMVRDLNVPVEILPGPTVRESDGLAMSSRNIRLTPQQRADAPRIRRALLAADELVRSQAAIDASTLLGTTRAAIESPLNRIDYLELVDATTLRPVADFSRPAVIATAVFYGDVRLIDNLTLGRPKA